MILDALLLIYLLMPVIDLWFRQAAVAPGRPFRG
jgi:hypothetical protein